MINLTAAAPRVKGSLVLHSSNDTILAYCSSEEEAEDVARVLANLSTVLRGPLKDQVLELVFRAAHSVSDMVERAYALRVAEDALNADEFSVDGDAIISDNEDDGYWVTCRVFVRYAEE